ncbi:MAG: hypothetical protein WDK96_00865 [Candidatus Paceibacterota bacterium]
MAKDKNKKSLIKKICVLIFFIFFVNLLAMKFYWYFSIWWFDMFVHLLGGLFISLLIFWIYYYSGLIKNKKNYNKKFIILLSALGVLVIGIFWEIFEFNISVFITHTPQVILDIASDLFFGVCGSFVGSLYFFIRLYPQKNQELGEFKV